MSLDESKLEKIKGTRGKITFRCPACAEDGGDNSGEHGFQNTNGAFGCVKYPGPEGAAHRKRMFELAGVKDAPAAKSNRTGGKVHATRQGTVDAALWSLKQKHRTAFRVVASWTYHIATGATAFEILRCEPEAGAEEKQYAPIHPVSGGWRVGDPAGVLPLYRLPEINASKGRVYVCEGEKCADALVGLGLVATTSAHGAKSAHKSDWQPLAGHEVVILPDADNDGAAYAKTVAEILSKLNPPAQVRIVALTGLSTGQDVFDFIERRKSEGATVETIKAEIEALSDAAPVEGMKWMQTGLTAAAIGALELPELRYLVPNVLPEGLNVLAGRPKIGKSWLALDFALAVAFGGYAVGALRVEQAAVLYLALEDGARRMQDRLRHITSDALPPGLTFFFDWPRTDDGGLERLGVWLDRNPACRFVIVDTLQKIKAQSRFNANAYEADYAAMEGLQRLAIERRVCVLLVHHLRKSGGDDILDSVSGSVGITGASDAVLILERGRREADAVLHITGRDVTESRLALQFDAGRWKFLGDVEDVAISDTRRKILNALADGPLTPKEIADATGITHGNARAILGKMQSDQQVIRGEDHKYAALTGNSVNSNTPQLLTVQTCECVNGVNALSTPPAYEVTI